MKIDRAIGGNFYFEISDRKNYIAPTITLRHQLNLNV